MTWQIDYALQNFENPNGLSQAEHLRGETIKISTRDKPDVLAVISAADTIDKRLAEQYHQKEPDMDFLCGYRSTCVWEGGAISYLEENQIGWGSFGTLTSAALDGNANIASHKVFLFSDRLIRQYGLVSGVSREFDRVYRLTLKNGRSFRLGMIAEYEPAADAVRSFWDTFGPVDVMWNINPNGNPTQTARDAGHELGCKVVKWEELKSHMKRS